MSCYFRHIGDLLEEAGITVTKANKKQVDEAIHQAVGVGYKDCPATWRRIEERIRDNEGERQALSSRLRAAVGCEAGVEVCRSLAGVPCRAGEG